MLGIHSFWNRGDSDQNAQPSQQVHANKILSISDCIGSYQFLPNYFYYQYFPNYFGVYSPKILTKQIISKELVADQVVITMMIGKGSKQRGIWRVGCEDDTACRLHRPPSFPGCLACRLWGLKPGITNVKAIEAPVCTGVFGMPTDSAGHTLQTCSYLLIFFDTVDHDVRFKKTQLIFSATGILILFYPQAMS